MAGKYLAGIDIGTTGSKAAIFDLEGNMLGSGYREYSCSYPRPNWIEQDPDDLLTEAMEASAGTAGACQPGPAAILRTATRTCISAARSSTKVVGPVAASWHAGRSPWQPPCGIAQPQP